MMRKLESVCVIDDDMVYQFLAKEEIEYTNLVEKIMFFSNGEKAIQFITATLEKEHTGDLPDIIFLDINMPVMDGWEFLEAYAAIKPQIGKNIIIYMVSSSTDMRDFDRARAISEVSDYIIKPVSSNQLQTIFKGLIEY